VQAWIKGRYKVGGLKGHGIGKKALQTN